jgi:hypothetical protein
VSVFIVAFSGGASGLAARDDPALARVASYLDGLGGIAMLRAWPTPSPDPDFVVVGAPHSDAVTDPLRQGGVDIHGLVELMADPFDERPAEALYNEILPQATPQWLPLIDGIEGPWVFCPGHGYPHPPPIHTLPQRPNAGAGSGDADL